ncbi:MAG TPA: hypothetical protein VEB60_02520, partial [Candidatus Paceibacterota bacterium]|nr:hypothetical protein [Candidatus Paceibacterota bacterium]
DLGEIIQMIGGQSGEREPIEPIIMPIEVDYRFSLKEMIERSGVRLDGDLATSEIFYLIGSGLQGKDIRLVRAVEGVATDLVIGPDGGYSMAGIEDILALARKYPEALGVFLRDESKMLMAQRPYCTGKACQAAVVQPLLEGGFELGIYPVSMRPSQAPRQLWYAYVKNRE